MSRSKETVLATVKVDPKMPSGRERGENEFVYVNSAFVGSFNDVSGENERTRGAAPETPVAEVYREQYWACSRWPYTQRILAIAVGLLLGALIGLTISYVLQQNKHPVIGPFFTREHFAPD